MTEEMFGTGACGVNCLTCKLGVSGQCTPCGPGTGDNAVKKLGVQLSSLGGYCPILRCAVDRKIGFCMRDCGLFPCKIFKDRDYPFSQGYLEMQKRRRKQSESIVRH